MRESGYRAARWQLSRCGCSLLFQESLSLRIFFLLQQKPWRMRTTLELPDPLFARLKARAASQRLMQGFRTDQDGATPGSYSVPWRDQAAGPHGLPW